MSKVNKLLFLRPGKLGDMIVATPLFKAIKRSNSDTYIAVACSPYNEIIIRNNPNLNCIRVVNYHSILAVLQLIFWIRKQKFDWVIDLTPGISRTSTMVSRLIKSPVIHTAGMHKGEHSRYFTKVTDFKDMHVIDRNKLLVENVLNCSFKSEFNPDIAVLQEHEKKADALLNSTYDKSIRIGINCSAGDKRRQWSESKYLELVKLINEKIPKASVVLFSVGVQDEWVLRIQKSQKRVVPIIGVDILTVAALIKRMSFFVTPDTSLLHIASGSKIPIIGLYCVSGENLIRWRTLYHQQQEIFGTTQFRILLKVQ
jgi:ADP-heptose:LPS heptosyltransferase